MQYNTKKKNFIFRLLFFLYILITFGAIFSNCTLNAMADNDGSKIETSATFSETDKEFVAGHQSTTVTADAEDRIEWSFESDARFEVTIRANIEGANPFAPPESSGKKSDSGVYHVKDGEEGYHNVQFRIMDVLREGETAHLTYEVVFDPDSVAITIPNYGYT